VLGSEVVVLVTLGFLSRQDDDLPTLVRESFEHPASLIDGDCTYGDYGKPIEISGLILTRSVLSVKVAVELISDRTCSYTISLFAGTQFVDFSKTLPIESRTF
jgi:hypothetical protein